MLLRTRNYELVRFREKNYLTEAVTAADTTLTLRALDNNAWSDNDYFILGEIGSKNAEILQVNGAPSDGTALTFDNNGSGGARFNHSAGEPLYRTEYNRVEFSRATTEAGTKAVLATNELQVDDHYTRYEDTANATGFGFARFNNQTTGAFSTYSDGIPYTGYSRRSLGRMLRAVRRNLGERNYRYLSDDDIVESLNGFQRDVGQERLWPFYEDIFSFSTVAYQRDYALDENVQDGKVHALKLDSKPLVKVDAARYDVLQWDTNGIGTPDRFSVWNNSIRLDRAPSSAATATTLNGTVTAAATTITLTAVSGLRSPGRLLIDAEVISYEDVDSATLQLRGVQRAREFTTASAHTTGATVTERDGIYTAWREPRELVDVGDETKVPDPDVLVYGASMDLALGKLKDDGLHDRYKLKYDQRRAALRDKFGRKGTAQVFRIKDRDEVVSDSGRAVDPNQYPTNIG